MGVHIIAEEGFGKAVLYDSVTEWAFGPLFSSRERAETFLTWSRRRNIKLRLLSDSELQEKINEFNRMIPEESQCGVCEADLAVDKIGNYLMCQLCAEENQ